MTTTLIRARRVHTGVPEAPSATWVLLDAGRVAATGDGEPPAARRTLTLGEATIVPAFRDGHVHLPATGLVAAGLDLRGVRSAGEVLDAFRSRARDGGILFGGNLTDNLDGPLTISDLDEAVGGAPALAARADLHSCLVTTPVLEKLALDGVQGVDRDGGGAPTGWLREQAASEAWRWFDSSLTDAQQRAAIEHAIGMAYSKGIAEVHEMFVVEWRGWDAAELFLDAVAKPALKVITYLGTTDVARVRALGHARIGGDWFLDGSFGSHTAWMSSPYLEAPPPGSPDNGIAYRADEEVHAFFAASQDAGMQTAVHAIGDAAIDQCLTAWEAIASQRGIEAVRRAGHRIEHFECATDAQIERASRLGLRASIQPAFDAFWGGPGGLYARRLGWERAAVMNRFRTMDEAGIVLGGGSDSTVTPLDPFLQMAALRSHHVPGESLDPPRALQIMTAGVTALAPEEGERGTLVPGAAADLCALDRDPLAVDAEEMLATEVLGTWVDGTIVWPPDEAETA